jgi:iron complex transport system substrate-binding protein
MIRRISLLVLSGALVAATSLTVTTAQAAAHLAAPSDPFPVTVEHKFGETTIDATPERIVTVGLVEQDALLALGVAPIATTEWFGEQPGAIFPWAMDELEALGAPIPESLGTADAVNFEAVAAQDPDLIIAIYAGLTQADYDRLAEIAPTIAQPAGVVDYGAPWDVSTRMIGLALGKSAEAEALIAGIHGQFAAVREAHPEFQGATAVAAAPYEGIWVYAPEDPRGRFLGDLGFEMPEGLAEITGDEFGADLSEEQSALLDVDAVIWITDEATGTDVGGPVYRTLAVHTEGREVFVDSYDNGLGSATSFVTPLSLEFLLDGIVPKLTAAIDGDPDTVVPD